MSDAESDESYPPTLRLSCEGVETECHLSHGRRFGDRVRRGLPGLGKSLSGLWSIRVVLRPIFVSAAAASMVPSPG